LRSGSFVPNEVFNGGFTQAGFMGQLTYYGHEGILMAPDLFFGALRLDSAYAQGQLYDVQTTPLSKH
jgi:hypothetical protein